jgi:hypothetical protein
MAHQILAILVDSATAERVCSYAGLTISETQTCASLLDDTLEAIMWFKWESPSIPAGRGDLHITNPELCD